MKMTLTTLALTIGLSGIVSPLRAESDAREEYTALSETCRTTPGDDGKNPCGWAMSFYGGRVSAVELSEPLALLWENCIPGGKITGCGPLANYYGGQELLFADGSRKTFPIDEKQRQKALETGCDDSLEGVSSCGSLGVLRENAGDFQAANLYFSRGCSAGMRAKSNEYYGQDRVCYWAARNARNNLQAYADALRWFGYICDKGDDPFACKFLGLMHAQGEGVVPDPLKALNLYGRACNMTPDITMGDGQACLFYGQSLIAMHGDLIIGDDPDLRRPFPDEVPQAPAILTLASRALLRGCLDDQPEACRSHNELFSGWIAGRYPRREIPCRVVNATGHAGRVQSCGSFDFALPAPEAAEARYFSKIYIWPDGDRTLVYDDFSTPLLNGAGAEWDHSTEGWNCLINNATGRKFCAAQTEAQ